MSRKIAIVFLAFILAAPLCAAYSFLTHETLIDIEWHESIRPVLLSRYPNATPAELRVARSYAYGGSTIQDAGYYPFGHALFSDLTHYVRTGDFITNLFRESRNIDELAFSLGALSHYVGDTVGHRYAVNISVPQEFPGLENKYGPVVTYEENPHAHVRTEFAFDVDQLSHARFAPSGYLRHVGFRVPIQLLNRAFYDTYGITLHSVIGDELASFHSYSWSVRTLLPRVGYAEALLHRSNFPADEDNAAFHEYADRLKATDTISHWEAWRKHRPSFVTRLFAALIFITPKFGAMSDLAIRGPSEDTEQNYVTSVNRAVAEYTGMLQRLAQKGQDGFSVPDLDLDTGFVTKPGTYRLTDRTYAMLLNRVTRETARPPLGLRQNILAFYADPNAPIETKRHARQWAKVQDELAQLRAVPADPVKTATSAPAK
ncbi:MAG TPA: zinc dependent phospholipase C family protein [Acidobacteriaceae bacterium]|nr:zinc dependent phospholipase C family protein [Acidobacteriaceae bacterium]